jgi:hypothetical protein
MTILSDAWRRGSDVADSRRITVPLPLSGRADEVFE